MKSRLAVVLTCLAVGAFVAFAGLASGAVASSVDLSTAPALSAHEQEAFGVSIDSPEAATAITSGAAVQAASNYLGTTTTPLGVEHALASMPGESPHSAWIVFLPGGIPAHGGPVGAQLQAVPMFMGIVVDDQSGEVLRFFGESRAP